MAYIENVVFPSFDLSPELRIISKNFTSSSRFAALRTGKSMSGITDTAGMNAIRGLSDGESTAITCFCPAPVGAVVCRCGEKYTVRINSVTAALVKRAQEVRELTREVFAGLDSICAAPCVEPENMPRLRRAVFLQQRINEYITRALLPLSEKFAPVDFTQTVRSCAAAASDALAGSGLGVVCTGDLGEAPVFVSRKDLAYAVLSLLALAFSLTNGRLVEIRIDRGKSGVSADMMFSVTNQNGARFRRLLDPEYFSKDLPGEKCAETLFLASYSRLMCDLSGGELLYSLSGGVAHLTPTFPVMRSDTVTLCSPPLIPRELALYAKALFECFAH